MDIDNKKKITLGYGSGGRLTRDLIESHILPRFSNPVLNLLSDGASITIGDSQIVFTSDSFVVTPLFFPGGNIGKLAVCGTVNDLAVSLAKPLYLSCSLIIEEGLPFETFDKIISSMATEAKKAGVEIVTGDTKVVEKQKADHIFINTAGIGLKIKEFKKATAGDCIISSGTLGDHGMTLYMARESLAASENLKSDCASLNHMIEKMAIECEEIKFMRDTTRGGLSSALNEFAENEKLGVILNEEDIPVREEVRVLCSMLGFDPLTVANEGKLTVIVSEKEAEKLLSVMKTFPEGKDSAIIGKVSDTFSGKVMMKTTLGGMRSVDMISGSQLPRIC